MPTIADVKANIEKIIDTPIISGSSLTAFAESSIKLPARRILFFQRITRNRNKAPRATKTIASMKTPIRKDKAPIKRRTTGSRIEENRRNFFSNFRY